jgi:hypothetical protein
MVAEEKDSIRHHLTAGFFRCERLAFAVHLLRLVDRLNTGSAMITPPFHNHMISECAIGQDPPVRLEQLVEAHPRGFLERPIPACGIARRGSKKQAWQQCQA